MPFFYFFSRFKLYFSLELRWNCNFSQAEILGLEHAFVYIPTPKQLFFCILMQFVLLQHMQNIFTTVLGKFMKC